MIKLVFIRHGQSAWNLENRFTGWTDVDLSEKGITEAHQAATAARNLSADLARLAPATEDLKG